MISYLIVGADDMVSAKRFYLSFLPSLNYVLEERTEGLSFVLEKQSSAGTAAQPEFYVKHTFDGRPASAAMAP